MIASISAQLTQQVKSAERTMRILWSALMMSVLMYGFVMFQLSRNREATPPESAIPPWAPPIIALALAAMGTALFRAMSSPDRVRALLQLPHTPAHDRVGQLASLPESERRLGRLLPMLFTLHIMRWAIFESIAIVGLVLGILTGSLEVFVPYGLAALSLIAMTPPRIKQQVVAALPLLPQD